MGSRSPRAAAARARRRRAAVASQRRGGINTWIMAVRETRTGGRPDTPDTGRAHAETAPRSDL
jgi:hypothetical protein